MIRTKKISLTNNTSIELKKLQKRINSEKGFLDRVAKAQSLWNTKGGNNGKQAFVEVKNSLYKLCVYEGLCNYCEQSEANDIEHIYPKSFYPEKTFEWENYILACKQCNSGYKLDKCHVLDGKNNLLLIDRGKEPPHKTLAFINPRKENPSRFMILEMSSFRFIARPGIKKRDLNRVKSTIDILELNDRDTLKRARKSAADHYYDTLSRLVAILNAKNKKELESLLRPYENRFDLKNETLVNLKKKIKESYKAEISNYQHPSVWYSIKEIQNIVNPKWIELFKKIPEALSW